MLAFCTLDADQWTQSFTAAEQERAIAALEAGQVVFCPNLRFVFIDSEDKFFSSAWSDGTSKNISFDATTGRLKGIRGRKSDVAQLAALMGRFAAGTRTLLDNLLPAYRDALVQARTSYRPVQIKGRAVSMAKDDSRLHPDAFVSRPAGDRRILRVFCNVNPHGQGRAWRLGESFEPFARRFLPRIKPPFPGSRTLLYWLRATRTPRTCYDHYMLGLHNAAKRDELYQKSCPQKAFTFPAGSTWLCFTDQVLHAVDAGQYLLEQTWLLPVAAMRSPDQSPQRIIQRLTRRQG